MRTPPHTIAGLLASLALAAGLAAPAAAQVMRCVDPASGKVTYTDEACARGEAAREVQPRQSAQEIEQERSQAEQALQRKYQRQQQEAELQRQALPNAPQPPGAAPDPAQSAQCQRARQALQELLAGADPSVYDDQIRVASAQRQADLACLTPAEYARVQAQRSSGARTPYPALPGYAPPVVVVPPRPRPPHQQPPRREITNCNVFRCYDKNGNTYPR